MHDHNNHDHTNLHLKVLLRSKTKLLLYSQKLTKLHRSHSYIFQTPISLLLKHGKPTLPRIIFQKAKSARGFPEFVQSHDNALDISCPAKQFIELLFSGVKGQVSYIEGGGVLEASLLLNTRPLKTKHQ